MLTDSFKYQLIIAGILLLVGWGVGYYMGSGTIPEPVTKTVTKYVPQMKPPDLGDEYALPNKELYYKPIIVEKLRVDTVYVPKEYVDYIIAEPNPIDINNGEVKLTYFNPELKRYEQQLYSVPERAFDWNIYVSNRYHILSKSHYVGIEGDISWKRIGITSGAFYSFTDDYYVFAGLRIKLN